MAGELGALPGLALQGISDRMAVHAERSPKGSLADRSCGVQRAHRLNLLSSQLRGWMMVAVAYTVLAIAIVSVSPLGSQEEVPPARVLDAVHDVNPGLIVPDARRIVADVQGVLTVGERTPQGPFQ